MPFPVYFPIGPLRLHPHWVLETLGYAAGFRYYLWLRARSGDFLDTLNRAWIVAAAVCGAAAGSRILNWFEDPALTFAHWNDIVYLASGKTIVGGLLGGTLAVEAAKKILHVTRRTGDLFAAPLLLGTAIGRLGCFLTGLEDGTYGLATALPWGIDFGDGLRRHPTQLYEVVFCLALIGVLQWLGRRRHEEGDLYRVYLWAYLLFRVGVEFLKPRVPLAGLSAIQWASLAGALWYTKDIVRLVQHRQTSLLA